MARPNHHEAYYAWFSKLTSWGANCWGRIQPFGPRQTLSASEASNTTSGQHCIHLGKNWSLLRFLIASSGTRAGSPRAPELVLLYPSPVSSARVECPAIIHATRGKVIIRPRQRLRGIHAIEVPFPSKASFPKKVIISDKPGNDREESRRINSNQENFREAPKNKESILIRDILSRLQDKWKSSENIAGEAVYHPYIKRLKALTEGEEEEEEVEVDEDELSRWKKRSIFFKLQYWEELPVRHNLDVMHVERNVVASIISTLLHCGKSKDGLNARKDLEELGIRKELHPKTKGKRTYLPAAMWSLSKTEKKIFCWRLFDFKGPDGYCSNISRGVSLQDYKIIGLKSHDYHVLMQQLLPIVIRGLLPKGPRVAFVRFCSFFNHLCQRVIDREHILTLEAEVVETLCMFETFFPPSFFDIMVHLTVHLGREARLGGPVHFRWMYPFERYMKVLKDFFRNTARPEGCIAECYLAEECIQFCNEFLKKTTNVQEKVDRNTEYDNSSILEGRPISAGKTFSLTEMEKKIAHMAVIQNMALVDSYVESSAKDTSQVVDLVSYYGRVTDIILLDYNVFYVPLFRCAWAVKGNGVKEEDGFTLVNLNHSQKKRGRVSKKNDDEVEYVGTREPEPVEPETQVEDGPDNLVETEDQVEDEAGNLGMNEETELNEEVPDKGMNEEEPDKALNDEEPEGEIQFSEDPELVGRKRKRQRRPTRMKDIAKDPNTRVQVEYTNMGEHYGKGSVKMSSYVRALVREHVPIMFDRWTKITEEIKTVLWKSVHARFEVDEEYQKTALLKQMGCLWRSWKSRLVTRIREAKTNQQRMNLRPKNVSPFEWRKFVKLKTSKEFKVVSDSYKERRRNQIPHTTSRKGMVRLTEDMKKESPNPGEVSRLKVWVKSRTRKDGTPVNTNAAEKIRKAADLVNSDAPSSATFEAQDSLSQLLGPDNPGRLRVMGRNMTKTKLACFQVKKKCMAEMQEKQANLQLKVNELQDVIEKMKNQRQDSEVGENSAAARSVNKRSQPKCILTDWTGGDATVAEGRIITSNPDDLVNDCRLGPTDLKELQPEDITPLGQRSNSENKCKLLDLTSDDVVVAEGRWQTQEQNALVNGLPLGPNAVKVFVDVVHEHNTFIWRHTIDITYIEDCLKSFVSWPGNKVVFENSTDATGQQSPLQKSVAAQNPVPSAQKSVPSAQKSVASAQKSAASGSKSAATGLRAAASGSKSAATFLKPPSEKSPPACPKSPVKKTQLASQSPPRRSPRKIGAEAIKANQKCKLLDIGGKKQVVAEGRVNSVDPDIKVHCVRLGLNAARVWVDIVKIDDAAVWRPSDEIEYIRDALGSAIAWPMDKLVIF
ncbi:putative transposase Ptta/En/Spm plant [Arabidopsis thaliana x Arabidopsis arenosa]|uniref:Putative transposase Ptta/En/Spm plant n=1 Tax=Arabidopsis thaliana x Arabidopsis arenosa TaxID=1240361 RepID=A0A8T1ZMB4_9BRAS|nr:putative transposase Ptta/En/Spm plant [Arabidopsis thaliana x Arabidopsis arenosa]